MRSPRFHCASASRHCSSSRLAALPWQPISVIGIAVAFYLGFKNNSSYDRTWEARKIWGGIVNDSRSFATAITAMIKGVEPEKISEIRRRMVYRHIAWLTALRFQLRTSRQWEHVGERIRSKFGADVDKDFKKRLAEEMAPYLSDEELTRVIPATNTATQLLAEQTRELERIRDEELIDDFRFIRMHELIGAFYDGQGKAERIKNFPFPRQYASTALWTTWVFAALLPFGLLNIFIEKDPGLIWMMVPFSALVTWVFFLMEKIGDYSENPFEGTYNDVPINSISRGIEIDMREMIGDTDIPGPVEEIQGFLL